MIDIGWRDVVQGLMIAPVIVRFHEACQGAFELPRAEVFFELDDDLHRPVIAFDLPLRHRVIRRAPRMRQAVRVQVVRQLLRAVAGDVCAHAQCVKSI